MSIKESLRRRQINHHAYEAAEAAENVFKAKKRYLQRLEEKNSHKTKQDNARRALLQQLDKSNQNANEETKYNNVLTFINNTVEMLKNEYDNLEQPNDELKVIEIAKNFSTHAKVIKKYAAGNLNQPNDIKETFIKKVEKINPLFTKYFELETIELLSL